MIVKCKLLRSGNIKVDVWLGFTVIHYTLVGYTIEEAMSYF